MTTKHYTVSCEVLLTRVVNANDEAEAIQKARKQFPSFEPWEGEVLGEYEVEAEQDENGE